MATPLKEWCFFEHADQPASALLRTDDCRFVEVQIQDRPKGLLDPAIYAPTLPGVIVAAAGFYVAHLLTKKRERQKEIADLCSALRKGADDAVDIATRGWIDEDPKVRAQAVRDTKRAISRLGTSVTFLSQRTKKKIDVSTQVSHLRDTATQDPFEEPERGPDSAMLDDLSLSHRTLIIAINTAFSRYY